MLVFWKLTIPLLVKVLPEKVYEVLSNPKILQHSELLKLKIGCLPPFPETLKTNLPFTVSDETVYVQAHGKSKVCKILDKILLDVLIHI